jgi:hypothetical protein
VVDGGAGLLADELLTAKRRCHRGDQAHHDGEDQDEHQPCLNGPPINWGKNDRLVSSAAWWAGRCESTFGAEERGQGVVAEERGDQVAARGLVREPGGGCRHAVGDEAARHRRRHFGVQAEDLSVKKRPIDSSMPALLKVTRMPDATPRSRAGTEFMIEAVLGEANNPMAMPLTSITTAKGA